MARKKKRKRASKAAEKIVVHQSDVIVDVYGVAKHFKLDPRRVQQLAKDGLPKRAKNEYPLIECLDWYIEFLQRALENKGANMAGGDVTLWKKEKSRALTVTAELKELELSKKRGELVTVAESRRVLLDLAYLVKARIMAVPPRIAPDLLNQDSRTMIQAIVEKHLNEALSLLAKDKPAECLPIQTSPSL